MVYQKKRMFQKFKRVIVINCSIWVILLNRWDFSHQALIVNEIVNFSWIRKTSKVEILFAIHYNELIIFLSLRQTLAKFLPFLLILIFTQHFLLSEVFVILAYVKNLYMHNSKENDKILSYDLGEGLKWFFIYTSK